MVKLGMKTVKDLGVALAVLVVGLGLVGQGGLISGMVATIVGIMVIVGGILSTIDSLK